MKQRCRYRAAGTIAAALALTTAGGCAGDDLIVSATLPATIAPDPSVTPATTVGPASALFTTTAPPPGNLTSPGDPTSSVPPDTVAATEPPNPCGADARLPGEALEFRELTADLTGDGLPDLLRTFGLPTADGLMRWRARLDPTGGPASEIELDDAYAPVQPVGAVQVDRTVGSVVGLADEVLLAVGTSADTLAVQVLSVDPFGCVVRMGDGLGGITTIAVGASPERSDGLRCESTDGSDYVVQIEAVRSEDGTFITKDTRLQRIGTNLVPYVVTDGTASPDGAVLPRYSSVDCAGIDLPTPR